MNNTNQKILFRLSHNSIFKAECKKVREKITQSEAIIIRDEKSGKTFLKNYGLKESFIIKEPYRIAKQFELPSEWVDSIRNHILTGKALQVPPVQSLLLFDKDLGRWELYSPLHKKTSQLDLENTLKATKRIRKSLKEAQPKRLTKRDVLMAKEYELGKPMKVIKQILDSNRQNMEEESMRKRFTSVRREFGIKVRPKKTPKKLST